MAKDVDGKWRWEHVKEKGAVMSVENGATNARKGLR
jgi:hypothetical protein